MNSPSSATRPQPRPGILDIAPYVPGRSGAAGIKLHKLSSNESPLGASLKAKAAFAASADSLEFYPDGSATILREAIAARFGLNPDRIVCGAGSDELLQLIAHAFLSPGDEAIYSQHGFLVYPIVIMANGATAPKSPRRRTEPITTGAISTAPRGARKGWRPPLAAVSQPWHRSPPEDAQRSGCRTWSAGPPYRNCL